MAGETPYAAQPPRAFWKTAVAARHPSEISDLWWPKWATEPETRYATAGSCFAQHLGAALCARGLAWVDAEPAPARMPQDLRTRFSYGQFSCRTGNIYTARQFRQWLEWSLTGASPPDEAWRRDDRWIDPFRPRIEPEGFGSEAELQEARKATLAALRTAARDADVFIFTLGQTEGWRDLTTGVEYPICPGVAGGEFNPQRHVLKNATTSEVRADVLACLRLLRRARGDIRMLLTVSPVPMTATANDEHVLVASTHTKSVLRAVAGELAREEPAIDYFPSYEIITAPPFRASHFQPNMREVAPAGVESVMSRFLGEAVQPPPPGADGATDADAEPDCDDRLLDRYAEA